jgi:hypothetical protein
LWERVRERGAAVVLGLTVCYVVFPHPSPRPSPTRGEGVYIIER